MSYSIKTCLSYLTIILLLLATDKVASSEDECIDYQGHTVVHGLLYIPGPSPCSLCTCWNSEPMWCKAIYCDPPFFCKDFRLGDKCCEWTCLDKPGENPLYELRIKKRAEILAGISKGTAFRIPNIMLVSLVVLVLKIEC
ncbi:uncharacterized protein LOC134827446 [Culicoides brevitarsis]|uniref:uncharacterized protein LOC134827446 n=1 Tax=Culicoides brevitarsis TaxID=469753 RepID=UPI00307BC41E